MNAHDNEKVITSLLDSHCELNNKFTSEVVEINDKIVQIANVIDTLEQRIVKLQKTSFATAKRQGVSDQKILKLETDLQARGTEIEALNHRCEQIAQSWFDREVPLNSRINGLESVIDTLQKVQDQAFECIQTKDNEIKALSHRYELLERVNAGQALASDARISRLEKMFALLHTATST